MTKKLRSDSGGSEVKLQKDPATGFARFNGTIAREGVYVYSDTERVYVPKELLQNAEANAKLAGLPILVDHTMVDVNNAKKHSVGAISGPPEYTNGSIVVNGLINDKEAIDKIEKEEYKQLSPCYDSDSIEEIGEFNGVPYTHRQTRREYMHLALCKQARGTDCSIIFDSLTTKEVTMITVKYKGVSLKFDSQAEADEALKKLQETDSKKSDSAALEEALSKVKELQADLEAANAKIGEAGDEAAQKAAEAEIMKAVAEKLQVILEAMSIAPDSVNADSVKGLKYDSNAIMALALGIKYDSKEHTPDFFKGALEIAKTTKLNTVPNRIKSDSKSTLSEPEQKLHNQFYED